MIGPLHTTGSVSFSNNKLVDIMSIPVPVLLGNKPSSVPLALPVIPNALGIEGPVISASRTAAWWPFLLAVTASIDVTRDLPTPPFPLTTPITFLTLLISCGFALKSVCCFFLSAHSSAQLLQLWLQFSLILISSFVCLFFLFCLRQGDVPFVLNIVGIFPLTLKDYSCCLLAAYLLPRPRLWHVGPHLSAVSSQRRYSPPSIISTLPLTNAS